MRFLTLGLFALMLSGCGSSKPRLNLFIWSDFIAPEVIESFEVLHDCVVIIDTFDTNEAMYAKLKTASPGYDLIFPSQYYITLMEHEGLLHRLDPSRIKNLDNIALEPLNSLHFERTPFAIPYLVTFTGIAWNESRVKVSEPSWDIFSTVKYRGRMTMLNDIREVIGAALITLGYSINSIDQNEINEARDLVIQWKHQLAKFESEQYKIGLATNEYYITQCYNTDIGQLQEEVKTIQFGMPKEGAVVAFDMVAMPYDAVNTDLAYAFLNYLLDPKVAARNMSQTKGFTPVRGVFDYLDPSYRDNRTIFPLESDLQKCQQIQDLGKYIKLYTRAWDQIKND